MKYTPLILHIDGSTGQEMLTCHSTRRNGMLICTSGRAGVIIGAREYRISPGDMLVIVQFSYPTWTYLSEDFKGTLCIADLEFVFNAINPVNLSVNLQFVMLHPYSHPSEADAAALLTLIDLIEERSRFASDRSLSSMMIDNIVNALAYLVLDSYMNFSQTESRSSNSKGSIILKFYSDLSRDYVLHRKVAHYAGLQNLTPRYFSTVIKAVSGYTPLYWINKAVTAEARRLMCNSNMSIKEIAYQLNFASPTFFARWYRDCTGETPSQYRIRCRITLSNR